MGCCFLCQNARLNVGDGMHSMKFTCVSYQLGQVGSKADVAQQVDDMAVFWMSMKAVCVGAWREGSR